MKRGQIIKQVILDKCKERGIFGYTNLQSSDIASILETLSHKGIELSLKERIALGFDNGEGSHFQEKVPNEVKRVITALKNYGYQAYLVGGCVRDYLMDVPPHDYDICTNALPEQVKEAWELWGDFGTSEGKNPGSVLDTGLKHGTVTVMVDSYPVEVTTFRSDGEYSDGRHPDKVEYVKNVETDLARRDFTVNAMAYNAETGEYVDPFGGREDLRTGIIKAVGNPDERFKEDGLRILRALRFAIKYGFTIEDKTFEAMIRNKECLQNCSKERITEEFRKIFETGKPISGQFLKAKAIIFELIPELRCCDQFEQNNKYHKHNVYEHLLAVTDACSTEHTEHLFELKMASLLHDIGKPYTCTTDEAGQNHFYGHPKKSAELAKEILYKDFRLPNTEYDRIIWLVNNHDMYIAPTPKAVKRVLRCAGESYLRDYFVLKQADIDDHIFPEEQPIKDTSWFDLSRQKALFKEILDRQECFSLKDLAVTGSDLMDTLQMKQGKEIGDLLKYLLEGVIEGRLENRKELLLKASEEYMEELLNDCERE